MKMLIISGGHVSLPFASEFVKGHSFDRVIAADSGLSACHQLGLVPTDILGDFDSLRDRNLLDEYGQMGIPIREFPSRKDFTDTELAVLYAQDLWEKEKTAPVRNSGHMTSDPPAHNPEAHNPETYNLDEADTESGLWILGATGTRLDHTLSNLGSLVSMADLGIPCMIVDEHNEMEVIKGPAEKIYLPRTPGDYLSILALSGPARGIDLIGFSYPMEDGELQPYISLGISNEIIEKEATLRVREGRLLVIRVKD